MEYNAEKVMMGLHSCSRGRKGKDDMPCLECPYEECNIVGGTSERQTKGTCQGWLMKDAIALLHDLFRELKEKDAEMERLKAKAYTNNYCQEVVLESDIDKIAKEIEKEN